MEAFKLVARRGASEISEPALELSCPVRLRMLVTCKFHINLTCKAISFECERELYDQVIDMHCSMLTLVISNIYVFK